MKSPPYWNTGSRPIKYSKLELYFLFDDTPDEVAIKQYNNTVYELRASYDISIAL